MQRVCEASALSQEPAKPWPASIPPRFPLLPEPASLRHGARAPPREEEEARQTLGSSKWHWAASAAPADPSVIPPHQPGVPTGDPRPPTRGREPPGHRQRHSASRFYWPVGPCPSTGQAALPVPPVRLNREEGEPFSAGTSVLRRREDAAGDGDWEKRNACTRMPQDWDWGT